MLHSIRIVAAAAAWEENVSRRLLQRERQPQLVTKRTSAGAYYKENVSRRLLQEERQP